MKTRTTRVSSRCPRWDPAAGGGAVRHGEAASFHVETDSGVAAALVVVVAVGSLTTNRIPRGSKEVGAEVVEAGEVSTSRDWATR